MHGYLVGLFPFQSICIHFGILIRKLIFNFSTYQGKVKDEILDSLALKLTEEQKINLYKKLQDKFYNDEPVTFLYWFDNIIVYNKRISKIKLSQLGLVMNAWEWQVD